MVKSSLGLGLYILGREQDLLFLLGPLDIMSLITKLQSQSFLTKAHVEYFLSVFFFSVLFVCLFVCLFCEKLAGSVVKYFILSLFFTGLLIYFRFFKFTFLNNFFSVRAPIMTLGLQFLLKRKSV